MLKPDIKKTADIFWYLGVQARIHNAVQLQK